MIYSFAGFSIEIARGVLRGPGGEIEIESRAYAVLCTLVENHDRLVSKEELLETVWHSLFVSDAAVATAIKSLRHVLGDSGSTQSLIRTVRGRRYRFAGQVAINSETPAQARDDPLPRPLDVLPGKPTIAVLPYTVVGSDAGARG